MVNEIKQRLEEIKKEGKLSVVSVPSFSFNDHPFRKPSVVIHFCGCIHHCRGCHSKALWNPDSDYCEKFTVEELKEKVLDQFAKAGGMVKGLVLLGGDPVEQYPLLADFLEELKREIPDLEVVLYTGYLFEELPERLLNAVNVVVDGKYVEELQTGKFPASSNQRVWLKSSKKNEWKDVTDFFLSSERKSLNEHDALKVRLEDRFRL